MSVAIKKSKIVKSTHSAKTTALSMPKRPTALKNKPTIKKPSVRHEGHARLNKILTVIALVMIISLFAMVGYQRHRTSKNVGPNVPVGQRQINEEAVQQ